MKKGGLSTGGALGRLIELDQLAMEYLGPAIHKHDEGQRELFRRFLMESLLTQREADKALSKQTALFREENREAILRADETRFALLSRVLDGRLGRNMHGGSDDPRGDQGFRGLVIAMRELMKLLGKLGRPPRAVELGGPYIADYEETLLVGNSYTILGGFFGNSGSLHIELDSQDMRIDLNIVRWRDESVIFEVPEDVSGVPFDADGRLVLTREDGEETSKWICLQPLYRIYFYVDTHSASGHSHNIGHDYRKDILFQSAVLPADYRIHTSIYTPEGINIKHTDSGTYISSWRADDPSSASTLSDPYIEDSRINVMVRISDDFYWNYTTKVEFFIDVPNGIDTPGWSHY